MNCKVNKSVSGFFVKNTKKLPFWQQPVATNPKLPGKTLILKGSGNRTGSGLISASVS
jgi:hypothetical protein